MRDTRGQSPEETLESYASAFPDADLEAIETHLALASASGLLARGIEARIRELGFELSRPRYTVVRMLYLSPGHSRAQSEIAQAMGVSGANVTQLIDALGADGWVVRVVSASDRRVTNAVLTEQGKHRAAKLVPAIVEFMTQSCATLTDAERHELRRLVRKVGEAVIRRD